MTVINSYYCTSMWVSTLGQHTQSHVWSVVAHHMYTQHCTSMWVGLLHLAISLILECLTFSSNSFHNVGVAESH